MAGRRWLRLPSLFLYWYGLMPTGKWCYGNRYFYSAKQKMVTWQGLAVEIQQITFEKPAAK